MTQLARAARPLALAALLLGAALPARAQCAMCKATLESSEEGRRVSGELNRAILVMLVAPYAVFGTCASVLFRRRIAAFLKSKLPRRR
jgi:hypothetical protein